jgi:hypothetical protein
MPDPQPPPTPPPEVRRAGIDDHTWRAVESHPDRIEAGRIKAQAVGLIPLQHVQVALDQLVRNANDHRRNPVQSPFTFNFREYVQAELDGARRHSAVLRCAADAAASMIRDMESQLKEFTPMAQDNPDKPPVLTTTGEPHPLTKGDYDPDADPQRPAEASDVEALKEGKGTPALAEALARADTEGSDPKPAAAPAATVGATTSPEGAEKPPPIPPGEPRPAVTNPKDEPRKRR